MRWGSLVVFAAFVTASGCGEPPPAVPVTPTLPASKTDLTSLPSNAALYGTFLAGDLAKLSAATRGDGGIFSELGRASDEYLAPALAAGLDGKRPILVAAISASEPIIRNVVNSAAAGASLVVLQKLESEHSDEMTRVRVILPVTKGADRMALANLIAKELTNDALESCPKSPSCTGLGGTPLGVSAKRGGMVVAYADGADLRVDIGLALLYSDNPPPPTKAMEDFRTQRGGPAAGRCTKIESTKSASFCFDRAPFATMAVSQEYAMLLGAVSTDALTPDQRLRIAKAGRDEGQLPLDMARADVPTTDGTLSLDGTSGRPALTGSWLLDTAVRGAVAQSFATKQCATGNDIATKLAPVLTAAMRAKGPPEPAAQVKKEIHAGFGGIGMTAAGHWSVMVDGFLALSPELQTSAPPKLRACVASAGDRLTVTFDEAP